MSAVDKLERPQRAHHQIADIARPHFLEKRDRKSKLAAEQDVPQQHRADKGAAGAREEAGIVGDVILQEAPGHHLHRRPIDEVEQPRPRRAQQIPVAQHHRADAPRARPRTQRRSQRRIDGAGHCAASLSMPLPRATSRKTSSSVRPAVARQELCRRVVILDAAPLHDDDAFAQPLDLGHVVRGQQHRGVPLVAVAFEMSRAPSRRCRDRATRSARRAAARPGR